MKRREPHTITSHQHTHPFASTHMQISASWYILMLRMCLCAMQRSMSVLVFYSRQMHLREASTEPTAFILFAYLLSSSNIATSLHTQFHFVPEKSTSDLNKIAYNLWYICEFTPSYEECEMTGLTHCTGYESEDVQYKRFA